MNDDKLQILREMGIDVWERRDRSSPLDLRADTTSYAIGAAPAFDNAVNSNASEPLTSEAVASESITSELIIDMDWQTLENTVKTCTRCDLYKLRKQAVFGVGNRNAELMVIGEAPGADEDAQGEPFVGRAGQLLNAMLKAIGLRREQVFIANILKSRPPNNRDPAAAEVAACMPFLQRQIELVNPRLILCVGRIAAQNLLNTDTTIGKLRGQVYPLGDAQRPVVVTYHPAYLLRAPVEKRRAWQDLMLAMRTLENLPAAGVH